MFSIVIYDSKTQEMRETPLTNFRICLNCTKVGREIENEYNNNKLPRITTKPNIMINELHKHGVYDDEFIHAWVNKRPDDYFNFIRR